MINIKKELFQNNNEYKSKEKQSIMNKLGVNII